MDATQTLPSACVNAEPRVFGRVSRVALARSSSAEFSHCPMMALVLVAQDVDSIHFACLGEARVSVLNPAIDVRTARGVGGCAWVHHRTQRTWHD